MSSPFDALRKVIEHEANQDDDGGFFARLGGLEPDPEDDGPTARGLFQHWDTERDGPAVKWPPRTQPPRRQTMSNFKFDNHGELPTGMQEITNTTGHGILVSPSPRFGTSNYFTVRISIEEYNRAKHLQAIILRHRYWHDFTGQPRRNPTKQPLLHNGKAPR